MTFYGYSEHKSITLYHYALKKNIIAQPFFYSTPIKHFCNFCQLKEVRYKFE